jgi:hypothetical protein
MTPPTGTARLTALALAFTAGAVAAAVYGPGTDTPAPRPAALFATAEPAAPLPAPASPADCTGLDVSDPFPASVADALLSAGWTGDPADGREWLYPPGCVTP